MKEYEAELYVPIKTRLGEGVIWDAASKSALWVDINDGLFFEYHEKSGETEVYNVGDFATMLAFWDERRVLVSGQRNIYLFDRATKEKTLWLTVPDIPDDYRFNDGKFDAAGRMFIGTAFQGKGAGDGKLYRVKKNKEITPVFGGVTCSNGLCWTKDNKTMYYIDSPTKMVEAFDYDLKTGEIKNRRTAVDTSRYAGVPDGMTIDADGFIWVAMYGGYCVFRFNPDTAELDAKVGVPAEKTTCCAFAGDNRLLITTAGGCLYSADVSK